MIPFESPTDGKDAVVAGTVDFGIYGLAAATLGAGGPAGGHRGAQLATAVWRSSVAANSKAASIDDLKGKRVGIWPGSTQVVVFMDRLAAEENDGARY